MNDVKEAEVEAAFVRYLLERGWDVDTDKTDHADVVARRGAEYIVAEVKGTTAAPGLDVDTAYGQLLRRMGDRPEGTRFAIVVPESVTDPLGYYRNNTVNSRALIECAVRGGVRNFIFSSTAAVYGNPARVPVREDDPTVPMSPYGSSKLMTEVMLRDCGLAYGLQHAILRYFNVAGADPKERTGQSTKGATHLVKVAVETALGRRSKMDVFGTDYPTHDGTCVRDYIHVSDLVQAHLDALRYLRAGGGSATMNCGYGRGFSVLDVIDTVKRVSGQDFQVDMGPRRPGDPAQIVASSERARALIGWKPAYDDLTTIVTHALGWEQKLMLRNR